MTTLKDLPDYPAVQQIQSALWQAETLRGAAVMVGAGFSRLALRASEDMPLPPLWTDFAHEMKAKLGYADNSQPDPLKLAQEYDTALGRPALDGLIRSLVRDGEWSPGTIHERLMGLPWADVLTTNWDTVLERTPVDPDGPQYQVVRTVSDIAHTRSPRIVKLHGSLPSHTPFIVTEEDFRRYPYEFAPFVNTAQQALLENELCLIGFSGDDPNFLRWAGWVRDQLGASARRIRLVGVLNLSPSKRRMFEQQNISVVDLAPLVADLDADGRHEVALNLFLDSLWDAKPKAPHTWSRVERGAVGTEGPTVDAVRSLVMDWTTDRAAYPGWLLPPSDERYRVRMETEQDFRTLRLAFNEADGEEKIGRLLREVLWRYEISLWPLDPWLEEVAETLFASVSRGGLTQGEQGEMLGVLTSDARHRRDWVAFQTWVARLEAVADDDARARAAYERALLGRDQFNFSAMAAQVEQIKGRDPIWALRRAGVLVELGEPFRAAQLLKETRAEIQARRRLDPRSVWLLSRQAWTHWLWRSACFELRDVGDETDDLAADWDWPILYRSAETDPWDEMQAADRRSRDEAVAARKDKSEVRHSQFDPGVYTPALPGTRFTSRSVVGGVDELIRLADYLGLPRTVGFHDVIGLRLAQALEADEQVDEARTWLAARAVRSSKEGLIDERFGRLHISRLDLDVVRSLANALVRAIEYALPRMQGRGADGAEDWRSCWLERCVCFTELLSRLVVRLPSEEALGMWDFGLTLGHDPRWSHWWLFEPLANLMRRAMEAISPDRRAELAMDVLSFPLPDEQPLKGKERDWPEPIAFLSGSAFGRRDDDTAWANRITNLIHHARSEDTLTRTRAVWRLLVLYNASSLTGSEQREFAEALWSQRAEGGLPNNLELLEHIALRCPEPECGLAERAFRETVFARIETGEWSYDDLIAARQAALELGGVTYFPTSQQSLSMMRNLLAWQPRAEDDGPFKHLFHMDRRTAAAVGPALAHSIFPVLQSEDVSEGDCLEWRRAVENPLKPSMLVTLVQGVRLWPQEADFAASRLRKALASADQASALHGLEAVDTYRRAAKRGDLTFPAIFATDVVTACAVRREPGLSWSLQCARMLLNDRLLEEDQQERLISGLEFLQTETAYSNWNADNPRTSSLSLVRRECVRLAAALRDRRRESEVLEAWLSVVDDDPVPEVRFALHEADSLVDRED